LLGVFLQRAFRRGVSKAEVSEHVGGVTARMKAGAAFQDAMRAAYRQMLTAPEFLLRLEGEGEKREQFARASRLAFALWNSAPDDALLKDAAAGARTDPKVLAAHTDRLLADPKSHRFVADFLGPWLKLNEIDFTTPDKQLYPEYRPWLSRAMLTEARALFRELLTKDLGVTHFVKSDFTFLNEPLAELYGVPDVRGWDVRRAARKPEHHRGGLLAQGAVLKVSANGTVTSPVMRGAFVLERILGVQPAPPPADAGLIEPDTRGTTTVREQLEKHKRNASCAGCHAKMGPYGFALESFDVVGGWRDRFRARGAPNAKNCRGRPRVHGRGTGHSAVLLREGRQTPADRRAHLLRHRTRRPRSRRHRQAVVRTKIGADEVVVMPKGDVFRAPDGKTLASGAAVNDYPSAVVSGDVVYSMRDDAFSDEDGSAKVRAVRLTAKGGAVAVQKLWEANKPSGYGSPLVFGDVLDTSRGKLGLLAFDAKSGKALSTERVKTGAENYPGVVAAGGYVFAAFQDGRVGVAVAGREPKVLRTNELDLKDDQLVGPASASR
jgi:Protein of unknown function (DUF1592)/Protein of unknown function (DUF1588)/Protein of unknown function (DUF1595)